MRRKDRHEHRGVGHFLPNLADKAGKVRHKGEREALPYKGGSRYPGESPPRPRPGSGRRRNVGVWVIHEAASSASGLAAWPRREKNAL